MYTCTYGGIEVCHLSLSLSIFLSQSTTAETMARSRQLAGLGNIAAKDGHFSEAVRRFSEAIDLYPFDHRSVSRRKGEDVQFCGVPTVIPVQ